MTTTFDWIKLRLHLVQAAMAAELSPYDKQHNLERGPGGQWASKNGSGASQKTADSPEGGNDTSTSSAQSPTSGRAKRALSAVMETVTQIPVSAFKTSKAQAAVAKEATSQKAQAMSNGIAGSMDGISSKAGNAFRAAQSEVDRTVGKAGKDLKAVQTGLSDTVNKAGQFASDHALGFVGAALLVGAAVITKGACADVAASGMGAFRFGTMAIAMSSKSISVEQRALTYATVDAPTRKAIDGLIKLKAAEGLAQLGLGAGALDAGINTVKKKAKEVLSADRRFLELADASDQDLEDLDEDIRHGLLDHADAMVAGVKADLKGSSIPGQSLLLFVGVDPSVVEARLKGDDVRDRQSCEVQLQELSTLFASFVNSFHVIPDTEKDEVTESVLKQINAVSKNLNTGKST